MNFMLNIGTLASRKSKYDDEMKILQEQYENINNAVSELFELGWLGEAKEKIEQAHKQRQEQYKELIDDTQFIKNALENEVKPRAINLKKRSEDFVNCIKRTGSGGTLTNDDAGVISLNYGSQFQINNNINTCTNDYYTRMNSDFAKVMNIANSMEGDSFPIMGYVALAETSIQNQTTGLTEFEQSFKIYCDGVRDLEDVTCSIFSKISGVSDVGKFISSSVISPNGKIDKNKLNEIMLKDPGELTDEEKALLEYVKKVGQDEIVVPVTTVDTSKFTRDSRNRIDYLLLELDEVEEKHGLYDSMTGLIKLKDYDDAVNDIWDEINDIIADESTEESKKIADIDNRLDSIGSGTVQTFGGVTESILSKPVMAAGVGSFNPLIFGAGVYIGVDGVSNVTGGSSKIYNAIRKNNEGDTANFMKNKYIEISPKYGENIYNAVEFAIGCYSLKEDISKIPTDTAKVFPRLKNIARAETEGLEANTSVLNIGNKIVITTKTESGMILTRTVIDKAEEMSEFDKAGLAADIYNTEGSAESTIESVK